MTSIYKSFFNNHNFGSQVILGLAQLVAHLSLFYVIFYFSAPYFWGSLFAYFLMTCVGVSVTAHRYLSHRSFFLPRYFEIFGSLCFSLSLQGSTVAWVAMHREHHRHSDTELDPHAPHGKILYTHFLSMFYTPKIKYVIDLIRDPFHEGIHRYYWPINFAFFFLLLLAFGLDGVIYLYLFPAFLCWQAIGVAKTFSHLVGYRNFTTKDDSRNIPVFGILTFGEAWHNNHHARPANFSFQSSRYEIDPSALFIEVGCKAFGFRKHARAIVSQRSAL